MYALKEIREKLCRELDELAQKQEVAVGDLDILYKLTTTIKNIDKIEMYGGFGRVDGYSRDDGYSRTGEWGGAMRNSYNGGNSYRGRYSRGSSGEMMRKHIEDMMNSATDERTREVLQRTVDQLSMNNY